MVDDATKQVLCTRVAGAGYTMHKCLAVAVNIYKILLFPESSRHLGPVVPSTG